MDGTSEVAAVVTQVTVVPVELLFAGHRGVRQEGALGVRGEHLDCSGVESQEEAAREVDEVFRVDDSVDDAERAVGRPADEAGGDTLPAGLDGEGQLGAGDGHGGDPPGGSVAGMVLDVLTFDPRGFRQDGRELAREHDGQILDDLVVYLVGDPLRVLLGAVFDEQPDPLLEVADEGLVLLLDQVAPALVAGRDGHADAEGEPDELAGAERHEVGHEGRDVEGLGQGEGGAVGVVRALLLAEVDLLGLAACVLVAVGPVGRDALDVLGDTRDLPLGLVEHRVPSLAG